MLLLSAFTDSFVFLSRYQLPVGLSVISTVCFTALTSAPVDWLFKRRREGEEKSGRSLKIQCGRTEEEVNRRVGEPGKQASLTWIRLHSPFPSVSLLTRLSALSSSLWHEPDFKSVYLLCLALPLFLFASSHLPCLSGGRRTQQPVIKRTLHSGGRN